MLSYVQSILQSGTTQLSGVEYGLSLLLFVGAAGRLKNSEQKGQLNLIPGLTESDPALVSGQVSVLRDLVKVDVS